MSRKFMWLGVLLLAAGMQVEHTPIAAAEPTGNQLGTNIFDLVKNASYWSRKSTLITGNIPGFSKAYKDRLTGSMHFQGVAYLANGRFVTVHSVNPKTRRTCGVLAWSTPYQKGKPLTWQHECTLVNYHPSMIASVGNLVVVTDNWDNFGDDRDKFKQQSRIRFFDFSTGQPREIKHLTIYGHRNTVAITYNRQRGQYFLVTANPADYAEKRVIVYSSRFNSSFSTPKHKIGHRCNNLTDETCSLLRVEIQESLKTSLGLKKGQSVVPVPTSSSGGGLIDQRGGIMGLLSLYSPSGVGADFASVSSLKYSSKFVHANPIHIGENLGISNLTLKLLRPSCRWGCSLVVNNDTLYFVSVGRNTFGDEFQVGLYQVWPEE